MVKEYYNIKILIVDDNSIFINLLTRLFEELGIVNVQPALSALEGLKAYHDFNPDICFLDIELSKGKKNGGDLAMLIRKENSEIPIVFITSFFQESYYQYVKKSRPIGFMNKELSRLKLLQVLEMAAYQIEKRKKALPLLIADHDIQIHSSTHFTSGKVFFRVGNNYKPININLIDFFYAANKLTYAKVDSRSFPTSVQLKVLENELSPKFLRCHKKFLVNVDKIDNILLKEGKIKIKGELLTIGYTYRKKFLEHITIFK